VLEERARIARELHDVVAHHMSLIAIQAEAAPYRVPDAPPELARSLHTIRTSAVQAMDELRRILGVLRDPAAEDPTAPQAMAPQPTAPQPTLAGVDELVSTVAAAGQPVTLTVHGSARPLPPGLDLTAYRIVQEALSNATRHAPGAATSVTIDRRPDALAVSVVNDPAPDGASAPPPAGSGHGLLGMRERVAMLAGVLDAGPRPGGGYAVVAVLPTTRDGDPR
jgi:signal transduction histidine kinase